LLLLDLLLALLLLLLLLEFPQGLLLLELCWRLGMLLLLLLLLLLCLRRQHLETPQRRQAGLRAGSKAHLLQPPQHVALCSCPCPAATQADHPQRMLREV
jgi:hypothetical protein